jgi:DHA3 family macrolide efflux protein-like MFS transporter
VLIAGILLGLLLGLRAGGRLENLANIQLRWPLLLIAAVLVRFGTEGLLNLNVGVVDQLRVPLLATGFVLLLIGLWINRGYPGLSIAFVGILLNGIVIVVNGGHMPIWATSLAAAGLAPQDVTSALHFVVPGEASDFFLRALILGDIIPVPIPIVQNVASLGDLFLTAGLAFFLFASVVRVPTRLEEHEEAVVHARLAGLAGTARLPRPDAGSRAAVETGLAPALQDSIALERTLVLGGTASGLASPALAPLPSAAAVAGADAGAAPTITLPRPSPETLERVRRHPYVRLGLNGSFTSLWAGQLISLFGDRIHQLALAAAVLVTTGSALATALVFVTATIPNLLFSPIAGTLVDRWEHKEVLVVSDLLRAATVLLIPLAIVTNIVLVYPLVFALTSISIFFRPARVAILPQIVRPDELLTANSAMWVGETLADVIGFPLAGLFVVALGPALPIAFWLDAATYAASAVLLGTLVVRGRDEPVESAVAGVDTWGAPAPRPAAATPVSGPANPTVDVVEPGFLGELKEGWRFLRGEPVLLANTLQATVAQLTVGVLLALTPVYARTVFGAGPLGWEAVYAFIETGVGAGNLIGGFMIGLIGMRFAKGHMVIAGYAVWGLLITMLALTGNLALVLGFAFGSGIANMVFVIPSQTLFQERTPPELMGRVVGFRFALVFGAMTLAMALGGILAEVVGVTTVLAAFGLTTMLTGLAGLLIPAVRDA